MEEEGVSVLRNEGEIRNLYSFFSPSYLTGRVASGQSGGFD